MQGLFLTAAALFSFFGVGHRVASTTPALNDRHATSTPRTADISCVADAVAIREAALDSAMASTTAGINAAYSARATALANAYGDTSTSSIRADIRTAWSTFSTTIKADHQGWESAQQAAWDQYATAVKACGSGSADITDSVDASLDQGSVGN